MSPCHDDPPPPALLAGLNPAQLAAVTSPAAVVQVLAPPGSGKTKTLTARVAHLISALGYAPWDIIVCTFTVKAAREMQARLERQIGSEGARKLVLGTFHSVARRYLARYGEQVGLVKGWGIADAGDQKAIVKRIIKDEGLGIEVGKALGRISAWKSKGRTAEMARAKMKKKDECGVEFVALFEGYESALQLSGLLDYDDLLLKCRDLLRTRPGVVGNVRAVLIDEFQDTNEVQFDLMGLFAQKHRTITIVGDPDQSIYGWRNAEIGNLNKMMVLYPDTEVIFLEENYRSSGWILSAAQTVIEQDKARPDKKLQATHGNGEMPVLRRLPTAAAEAEWLVAEIKRSQGMGGGMLTHNDYAILLRSAQLSRHVEQALGKAGLPYRMVGGTKFYDRVEIKTLLDYLRIIEHPEHNDALLRVVNVPSRNVGEVTVRKLLDEASTKGLPMWKHLLDCVQGNSRRSAKLSAQAEKGLSEFINIILTAQRRKTTASPAELLALLLKRLDYETYLNRKYPEDATERWANVEELQIQTLDLTAAIESGEYGDEPLPDNSDPLTNQADESDDAGPESPLRLFLANISLSSAADAGSSSTPAQTVTISTIHAAKGLEWPVVFLPALYEGSLPHSRAEDTDEERRLLYVGMTRAQALLYLSCPSRNSQGADAALSSFLAADERVGRCFAARGPHLDSYDRVKALARTLGRPCPSREEVEASRLVLETWDDSFWPEDGSVPEEESRRWDYGHRSEGGGDRRGFVAAASLTVGATGPGGIDATFGSARSRMEELEVLAEQGKARVLAQRVEEAAGRSKRRSKDRVKPKHGGDIKSFFAEKTRREHPETTPQQQQEDEKKKKKKKKEETRMPLAEVRPLPQVPSTSTFHRVSSQPLLKRRMLEGEGQVVRLAPAMQVTGSMRAATTMHTTSMAALDGVGGTTAGKRTLGMGRSFKPWSARNSK